MHLLVNVNDNRVESRCIYMRQKKDVGATVQHEPGLPTHFAYIVNTYKIVTVDVGQRKKAMHSALRLPRRCTCLTTTVVSESYSIHILKIGNCK